MYVCAHVCMCACMYVRMYVCACTYVRMYVCAHICMYVCMCACMFVRMYVCAHVYMYVCMYKMRIKPLSRLTIPLRVKKYDPSIFKCPYSGAVRYGCEGWLDHR